MVAIDFHITPHKVDYLCRLVRKAHRAGNRIAIFHREASVLANIDERLWNFSESDFLPHCRTADPLASETPIILVTGDEIAPHHDVLINLDLEWPPHFSRFDRLIEVVGDDHHERVAGRVRYKFYKDRGYPLTTHDHTLGKAK